ncbi:MAG: TIGR03013 family XrtA/PEP-CTERM system glycosyltransferase [Halofilum sp. (in: g-proteobacteria)]
MLGRYYGRLLNWLPALEGAYFLGVTHAAVAIRLGTNPGTIEHSVGAVWPDAIVFAGVVLLALTAAGLYNPRLRDGPEGIAVRVVLAGAIATALLSALYYAAPHLYLGRGILLLALLLSFGGVGAVRWGLHRLSREEHRKRRVLVLGAGKRAGILARLRRRTDLIGLRLVGYVRYPGDALSVPEAQLVELDQPLSEWVGTHGIDELVVAPDERRQNLDMHELLLCRGRGQLISDLPTFYERETGRVSLDVLLPSWLAFSGGFQSTYVGERLKRLFDVVVSGSLMILASPTMLAAALAIWLEAGGRGPILYRQVRVGANEREFSVYKFRSMRTDAEKDGRARWASENDPRITRVGAILRRFRIDELPQIFNVLRGEMSFVGPRPERPEFVHRLEQSFPRYADRHRVKPGLTGWAQISYPYGASERDAFEKLQYDLYYVKNHSVYLDLTILLQTAEVVLWGKGAR